MAANNYYGFTHGGTQYNNQYPAPAQNPGYATSGQYGGGAGGNAGSQSYGGGAGGNDQYSNMLGGYARTPNQASGQQSQQQSSSYYGQTGNYSAPVGQAAASKPAAARPAASSTAYPTYSANTAGNASSSYAGFAQPAAASSGQAGNKPFGNYEQAVYNAVSAYAQGGAGGGGGRGGGSQGLGFKKAGGNRMKGPRPPPKPQTLHYCDVCKISCAGPQTYKEHLEGQKHKKKEAAAKVGTPVVSKGSPPGLRCELCDVTCTGNDAYAAHIRGAKHQKVLKLHTKLGKPIPSDSPTVVAPAGTGNANSNNTSNSSTGAMKPASANSNSSVNNSNAGGVGSNNVSKANPPKINFIGPKADFDRYGGGGAPPNSIAAPPAAAAPHSNAPDFTAPVPGVVTTPATLTAPATTTAVNVSQQQAEAAKDAMYMEKDIQPVGQDYIEEIKSDDGKIVSFNCKLCECRFNDPNAKEMHMKGRRHRLQYKKKVNPDLVVDVKPSSRQKKIEDRRANRGTAAGRRAQIPAEGFPRGPPVPLLPPGGPRGFGPGPAPYHPAPAPLFYIPPLMRRNDTPEDLYVMSKHSEIYPQEDELQAIQKIVSSTEKALKFVSDQFAEADAKKATGIKEEPGTETAPKSEADLQSHRILKGVMRVGHLAKGLLLKGDRTVELVVLCSVKPTLSMLTRISDSLPQQLLSVAPEEKYEVLRDVANASVVVASNLEPKIEVVVTLTSPLLRATTAAGEATANQVKDDPDLLDKEKCLDALAALRHAKWFQARATSLQSCVILIRIFRDICLRVPEWKSFPCWAIELLTEKVIQSVGVPVSPGDGFRLILEALSSGILLSNGLGLQDPCEKEPVDALRTMSEQERNDVTAFGQKALRLVTFRRIHEVLGVPVLERFTKKAGGENSRKRRRNESAAGEGDEGETGADGKKDKRDDAEGATAILNPHAEDGSLDSLSKAQVVS